jgi:predicted TIM-barrel fold metal-dependent hydrolase
MSAADQIAVMNRFGIDKAVILPMCNPEVTAELQGIDEILSICESYSGRFIPFCNVDPRLTGSYFYCADATHFEFILNQYKELGCKGLGEITAKLYWNNPALLYLFEACEKVGFPVTFHTTVAGSNDYGLIDEMGFPLFEKVLQKFPDLVFFAHSQGFWAEISGEVKKEDKWGYPKGDVKSGGAVPRLLRKYPQLYGDLSANSGLNALKRDVQHAWEFIDEFQDQLLFGLDYCSVNDDRQHIQWLQDARDGGHITVEAYEKIMWKNINRILKLDIRQE